VLRNYLTLATASGPVPKETTMRIVLAAVLVLAQALASGAYAAPKQVWETAGFENPESALYDAATKTIYVSNVAGSPPDKDGNGFISKLSPDGKVTALKWVTGLDSPKGMAIVGGKLYTADVDQLAEIDLASGKILKKYPAKDAKFLNDVAADSAGNIYVSDMMTNVIWRLSAGEFTPWLSDPKLINPNGLLIEGDQMIVGPWGVMTDGFATKVPGHMLKVSLKDKSITPMGDTTPVGNLDGVEPAGDGTYWVTEWMSGKLYRMGADGKATLVLGELGQGAADLGIIPDQKILLIPRMNDGKLTAFKVE
jgi:DNA-binding beta-propeller fold protein YncE